MCTYARAKISLFRWKFNLLLQYRDVESLHKYDHDDAFFSSASMGEELSTVLCEWRENQGLPVGRLVVVQYDFVRIQREIPQMSEELTK